MRRWRLSILFVGSLYLLFISFKFNKFLEIVIQLSGHDTFTGPDILSVDPVHENTIHRRTLEDAKEPHLVHILPIIPIWQNYKTTQNSNSNSNSNSFELGKLADEAWVLGQKAWLEIEKSDLKGSDLNSELHNLGKISSPNCPSDVSVTGTNIGTDQVTVTGTSIGTDRVIFLPCGLAVGSSLTLIGNPHKAHEEYVLHQNGKDEMLVSQFAIELQGLRDGEDPPKILHFNPRIKGDWSKRPVIEHNTCYRVQWATSLRCDGSPSLDDDDDKVDGFIKCEKWNQDNNNDSTDSEESESTSWLKRFMGRAKKPKVTRPFPFVEGRMFVLTIQAGVQGYHIFVGGLHVSSFPYRPGFTLEDARRLAIKGDVDIYSVYATELPSTHPSFFFKKVIEMSEKYRAPILQKGPVFLFIGILSVSNHFAERMAVRKTWMQSKEIKNSQVVTRFFVALNQRKEINEVLKKEAEYFGDIVILPLIDRYELIVLKTIAICDYGVKNISAAYVMKCDDDTFVRVNAIIGIIKLISSERPLYLGNLNLLHKPFRSGKWAVTHEEWPEDIYPPFANGPGYIISCDIAQFIVSDYTNQTLRLFKLEDVSMGIWVKKLNCTYPVLYSHSCEFCQYGCVENYFTAHYQSPRQMLCLWDKLSSGSTDCCDFR